MYQEKSILVSHPYSMDFVDLASEAFAQAGLEDASSEIDLQAVAVEKSWTNTIIGKPYKIGKAYLIATRNPSGRNDGYESWHIMFWDPNSQSTIVGGNQRGSYGEGMHLFDANYGISGSNSWVSLRLYKSENLFLLLNEKRPWGTSAYGYKGYWLRWVKADNESEIFSIGNIGNGSISKNYAKTGDGIDIAHGLALNAAADQQSTVLVPLMSRQSRAIEPDDLYTRYKNYYAFNNRLSDDSSMRIGARFMLNRYNYVVVNDGNICYRI